MTLKTSLFNKGLIVSDIKRFWWVSALYTLLLFFILPLRHIMLKNVIQEEWVRNQIRYSLTLNSVQNSFQVLLVFTIPVILGVLVFRYLQKSNAAAMMHSLPYTRKVLYCSHSASGLLLMILPIILNGMVLIILQVTTNLGAYYAITHILSWIGQTFLYSLLFFSVAVFVGMFTGSSIAQIVFSYILHILPAGIYVLIRHNLSQLIHGYSNYRLYDPILDKLPIFVLLNNRVGAGDVSTRSTMIYVIATVVFWVTGYYVYKLRNIESAGDVIAFKTIRPIFKYGVTVCSMFLGGVYFTSIAGGNFSTLILGYLLSTFLGYWIAEVLMEKSFKVLGAYKGYVGYTIIMLLILVGIQTDVMGYVEQVPNAAEVEKVYFGYHGPQWIELEGGIQEEDKVTHPSYMGGYVFESEENIGHMIELHEELIESRGNTGGYQYIVYRLKNGEHLKRYYLVDEQRHGAQLKPIYESLEYKQTRFPVLSKTAEDIKWIELRDDRVQKKSLMLTDLSEMTEFITVLQEDIYNASYEDLRTNRSRSLVAVIMDQNEGTVGYAINNYTVGTEKWLKDQGKYEEVILLPEDIEYIVLEETQSMGTSKKVEIRDEAVIAELVNLSPQFGYDHTRKNVVVWFYLKGSTRYQYIDYMPESILGSEALRNYIDQLNH